MMKPKALGSVLMILGTSIGAGMLALPIVTTTQSLSLTILMLLCSWALMTIGALNLLEINLWLKPDTNMVSMAEATLGRVGKLICWFVYLALLYSLICAYLSGTGDVLHALLFEAGLAMPRWIATVIALLIFSTIVYCGIGSVDKVNRALMTFKLFAYLLLVGMIIPFIHLHFLAQTTSHFYASTMMVMVTSFGYAIIVPSLRAYLESDVFTLRRVVLIGSLVPLFLYILWVCVVQGVVPRSGEHGLTAVYHSSHVNSSLMRELAVVTQSKLLSLIAKSFVSICVVTSFLGVSLCLFDFMSDGLGLEKKGINKMVLSVVSFLPPLGIVLWWPGIFIEALSYAGVCCVLLLILLPAIMLYRGRYSQGRTGAILMPGGKWMVAMSIIVGLCFILISGMAKLA